MKLKSYYWQLVEIERPANSTWWQRDGRLKGRRGEWSSQFIIPDQDTRHRLTQTQTHPPGEDGRRRKYYGKRAVKGSRLSMCHNLLRCKNAQLLESSRRRYGIIVIAKKSTGRGERPSVEEEHCIQRRFVCRFVGTAFSHTYTSLVTEIQ